MVCPRLRGSKTFCKENQHLRDIVSSDEMLDDKNYKISNTNHCQSTIGNLERRVWEAILKVMTLTSSTLMMDLKRYMM